MSQIEIDLSKIERGTREGRVRVTRGGKTFYRKQRIGIKEKEAESINYVTIDEVKEQNEDYDQETIESITDLIEQRYYVDLSISDGGVLYGEEEGEIITIDAMKSSKRGDGHKAMKTLIDIAKKVGSKTITLEAYPQGKHKGKDIIDLVHWYERFGFKIAEPAEFEEIDPDREYEYRTEFGSTAGIWMDLDLENLKG